MQFIFLFVVACAATIARLGVPRAKSCNLGNTPRIVANNSGLTVSSRKYFTDVLGFSVNRFMYIRPAATTFSENIGSTISTETQAPLPNSMRVVSLRAGGGAISPDRSA